MRPEETDVSRIVWLVDEPRGAWLLKPFLNVVSRATGRVWFWYRREGKYRLWFGRFS